MTTKVRRAKSQVFSELGFDTEEAANLRVRAELMAALRRLIEEKGLTQARAASALGVSQPRISDLVRGRIDRFSVDTLMAMLGHVGAEVRVLVRGRTKVA
jgi:predicted XRE-type DNA-binding protein